MKLVTYAVEGGAPRVGVLKHDGVHDAGFAGDMVAAIEGWDDFQLRSESVGREPPVRGAKLLAPLHPRSMRDFLAFEGHMKGAMERLGRPIAKEWYEIPTYYKAMPDTVIGPDAEIPWPAYSKRIDYELELALVIGKRGRDIPAARAMDYVFGWTIWNDVSARDVQAREARVGMGPGKAKDWDGSNVLGPVLVTCDELDGRAIAMRVRVNGALRGEDNTANMHHSFERMIEHASRAQTLYPGEVFGSGTISRGSGLEIDQWLRPGDVIELEVDGIGVLRNLVGAPLSLP